MVHASRKYCQCFVLLYVIVLQTQAAVATNGDECWWTGCQPRTWAVVGCAQYNRTQLNVKECVGGSEYYCCKPDHRVVPPANDCWWTGCQPRTWAVVGCAQYNRTQLNVKECVGGSEYYCCTPDHRVVPSANDCWWTGCQPNSWAVKGCDSYNRTEKNRMACEWDGFRYECCARLETAVPNTHAVPDTHVVPDTYAVPDAHPDENCWWTGCQPNSWAVKGCDHYNRTEKNRMACEWDGFRYECCARLETAVPDTYAVPDNHTVPNAHPDENCWWTGCQPNSWAVKGCDHYNRTEKNRMACEWDGFRYECCARLGTAVPDPHAVPDTHVVPDTQTVPDAHPEENCWWTGCQPDSWAVKGCDSYNRTEKNRMACEWDGFRYECCARPETTDPDIDIRSNFNDNCWWSECQPTDKSDRGCPPNAVRTGFHPCPGGDLLQCCWKNISTDGNM